MRPALPLSPLHSPQASPPPPSSSLSLFVLSNRRVEYHLSLSLPTHLQHPHSHHPLPHFLHLPAVAPTQPRTAPSIAINPSASLLRSPPRPSWELLPRLITPASPTATTTLGQPTLPPCHLQHTHSPNITWTHTLTLALAYQQTHAKFPSVPAIRPIKHFPSLADFKSP